MHLRQTEGIDYLADNFKADEKTIKGKVKLEIGKDIWKKQKNLL